MSLTFRGVFERPNAECVEFEGTAPALLQDKIRGLDATKVTLTLTLDTGTPSTASINEMLEVVRTAFETAAGATAPVSDEAMVALSVQLNAYATEMFAFSPTVPAGPASYRETMHHNKRYKLATVTTARVVLPDLVDWSNRLASLMRRLLPDLITYWQRQLDKVTDVFLGSKPRCHLVYEKLELSGYWWMDVWEPDYQ